jgi:Ser/Thr protein kinase RdoA (MazF antagonist)
MSEETLPEEPLAGGRSRLGVVRVGTTVRRPQTARSPYVQRVLVRLEEAGVAGVPRFLGVDSNDREILTYLDGETGHGISEWSDNQLIDLARLARPIHDALAGTSLAGFAETVCHLDLAPWNTILTADRPTAFIDFDDVAPGNRSDDLAYLLWVFLNLGATGTSPSEQGRRLRHFCDAYSHASPTPLDEAALRADLLPALHRQQHRILTYRAAQTGEFSAQKHTEILTAIHWADIHHATLSAHLT